MTGFGDRLNEAMRKKGIEQKKLAEMLEIPQPSLSRIVNGKQYLEFNLALKACELLDISLDWLAYGREPPAVSGKTPYYRNPDRQRIEYLLSIMEESSYPKILVALEGIIEIQLDEKESGLDDKKRRQEEVSKQTG